MSHGMKNGDVSSQPSSSKNGKPRYGTDPSHDYAERLQRQFDEEDATQSSLSSLAVSPSNNSPSAIDLYPKFIQNDLDEVQDITSKTMSTPCYRCGSKLMQKFSVSRWYKEWRDGQNGGERPSMCALRCLAPKCGATTCLGCGKRAVRGENKRHVRNYTIDWCCERGQLFAIWCLLCRYDEYELDLLSKTEDKQKLSQVDRGGSRPKPSTGTGYAGGYQHPGGFNPYEGHSALHQATDHRLEFKQTDTQMDHATKLVFDFLLHLLPLSKGERAPTGLFEMIELSLFQERAAQLLRNDSLEDVQKRGSLYRSLIAFVGKVGEHPDTRFLITDSRYVKKRSPGLMELSLGNFDGIDGKGNGRGRVKGKIAQSLEVDQSEESMSSSLLLCMKNLSIQSEALMKAGNIAKLGFEDASGQEMLDMAKRISSLYQMLNLSKKDGNSSKNRPVSKSTEWIAYHDENRVTYHAGQVVANLRDDLRGFAQRIVESPRGRLKALTLQMTDLHTSLPLGIFVKVAENRPDIMKFLIIGPDDTPYTGGLFEFDLVCPSDFPFKPPICVFRTNSNGQLRFNPNLHHDGKVCLSLLGTWAGTAAEQWQPGKSTILQVLVSIQAMIFSPTPWENEPGHQGALLTVPRARYASDQYNLLRQAWTVRFAMLDWLQRKEMREGIWKEVVRKYFDLNGGKVLESVRGWAGLNSLVTAYDREGARRGVVGGKENLLKELEALLGARKAEVKS